MRAPLGHTKAANVPTDVTQVLGDVYVGESAGSLRFGNRVQELVFSPETGDWIGWTDREAGEARVAAGAPRRPTLLLRVGGKPIASGVVRNSRVTTLEGETTAGRALALADIRTLCLDREVRLEITAREGEWVLTTLYTLQPGGDTVSREVRLRYEGAGEVLLRDVRLVTPPLTVGEADETTVEAPGYPVRAHYPLSEIGHGLWEGLDSRPVVGSDRVQHAVDVPGSMVGLVALDNARAGRGLMAWPHSTSEFAQIDLERDAHGVTLVTWLFVADRFTAGHALEAGRQTLRLYHTAWGEALGAFQRRYDNIGLTVPPDRSAWSTGTAIYELHIGSAPFIGGITYAPYPTMQDLLGDLPRIAGMGFEVIQIMPHFPFCGYSVHDYHDISQQYGDERTLQAVVEAAHAMGLRVILDVVLHGCIDQEIVLWDMQALGAHYDFIFTKWLQAAYPRSPYRDAHPDWFMRDETGETARIYTWAFDPASTAFQDALIAVLTHYVDHLGVDGFRFDAPTWNCMPNWARGLPYRPSAAYYGAHGLFVRARQALKARRDDILFYTEPSGPLFRHTMDLTYNYDEEWLSGSLMDVVSPRGYAGSATYDGRRLTAREVAAWLHDRQMALPAGAETVHHLDSHDTFWWGEKAQFRHEAFGLEAARALFALYACLDGGVMVYTGAERGSEAFYSQLLRVRQQTPALRYGRCDTTAIDSDHDRVLALLRTTGHEHAIPVINLGAAPCRVTLTVPLGPLGLTAGSAPAASAIDLLVGTALPGAPVAAGGKHMSFGLELEAYGVRIVAFRRGDGGDG